MTRKHFEAIAESFRILGNDDRNDSETLRRTAEMLAGDLKQANAAFDRERFLTACGLR